MPDNAQAPEQDLLQQKPAETTAAAAASGDDKPLTRKELMEFLSQQLGGLRENLSKEVQGIRSVTDRKFNTLQIQFQQAMARGNATASTGDDDGDGGQPQYDFGSDSDRALARVAARELDPYFDYKQIEPILNDQNVAPKYLRLRPDGKTFDWVGIYSEAWRDKKAQLADEYLSKQREQQALEAAKREADKKQAIISGSDASYPEGVKIPQTKEEARQMSDEDLAKAMMTQFDIPERELPAFVRENLKR